MKKLVRAVFNAAGLKGRYMGLHALRHTLATVAAERGLDMRKIQAMLGHDDIDTTAKVYAELRRGYLKDVAAVADAHIQTVNTAQLSQKTQTRHMIEGRPEDDEGESSIFSNA